METARAFWHLTDLMGEIVRRVQEESVPPSVAIDAMWPIRLRPEDQTTVLRAGLIFLANDTQGTKGMRSGKVQTARSAIQPLHEETAGLDDWALRRLANLRYQVAGGAMRSVLDFTNEDAMHLYEARVTSPRARAEREEPFWKALIAETEGGVLRARPKRVQTKLAKLAVAAWLTTDEEEGA